MIDFKIGDVVYLNSEKYDADPLYMTIVFIKLNNVVSCTWKKKDGNAYSYADFHIQTLTLKS